MYFLLNRIFSAGPSFMNWTLLSSGANMQHASVIAQHDRDIILQSLFYSALGQFWNIVILR